MYYQLNKIASRTRNTEPTLTDQSQRKNTDINIMLKGYKFGDLKTGVGAAAPPQYADYSMLPADFRDILELKKQIPEAQNKLPVQLRGIPMDELFALTPEQILNKLTPPPTTVAPKKDEPK